MNRHIPLLAAVALIGACSQQPPAHETVPMRMETLQVAPQAVSRSHRLPAFTRATEQAMLSFQVDGRIDSTLVLLGDVVKAGDVLMTLHNPSLDPAMQQLSAEIEAVNARIQQATREQRRIRELKTSDAVSQNQLDAIGAQLQELEASKAALNARLRNARALNDESLLRAPFAGTVGALMKESGEYVAPGTPVLHLGGTDRLETQFALPAALANALHTGDRIEADYGEYTLPLSITEISLAADPQSQLFNLTADVPMRHDIKSGERLLLTLQEPLGRAYRLPAAAVVDDGVNKPYVFHLRDGVVHKAGIEPLALDDEYLIAQVPGLESMNLIVSGQNRLFDGQRIAAP